MSIKAAIFDLDGTLIDSLNDIADSMNSVLTRHGFATHSTDNYRFFVGEGMRVLVSRALPQGFSDQMLIDLYTTEMKDEYSKQWNRKTRIYDGISELLQAMQHQGLLLNVLSNKPHDFTVNIVRYYFGNFTFKVVMGAGQFQEKPNPAAALHIAKSCQLLSADFLYIGDSAVDMKTAKSAGMSACGVLWGFRDRAELNEGGADLIVEKPDQIMELIA